MKYCMLLVTLVLCLFHSSALADAPTITITEATHGSWNFTGTASPPVAIVHGQGVALEFSWSATPGSGTAIIDYRYGWDLLDPNDNSDPGWTGWGSAQFAPPLSFIAGVHAFTAEARDDLGQVGRGTLQITIEDPVGTEHTTWGAIKALYR
jgi:hypothetical protein